MSEARQGEERDFCMQGFLQWSYRLGDAGQQLLQCTVIKNKHRVMESGIGGEGTSNCRCNWPTLAGLLFMYTSGASTDFLQV